MPKKSSILIDNIFKNKHTHERKQVFAQKITELINQLEKAKIT